MTTMTAHTVMVRHLANELVRRRENTVPTKATDAYALACLALEVCRFDTSPLSSHVLISI